MSNDTQQRVAVVTGASSGIGKSTAMALAGMGWHVIGVGRNPERSAAAESEIRAVASPEARVDFCRGDFNLMSDVRRVADEIKGMTSRLDTLINNAGGVRDRKVVTEEGNEATFAANHLAPFLLTRELMPLLKSTAASSSPGSVRVIAVSSSGHRYCHGFDWDDPQMLRRSEFTAGEAYCQAKLANLLFTRELANRAEPDGIVAQAMHPGIIDSNFTSHADENMRTYMEAQDLGSPDVPAETLVWLATAPEAGEDPGRYFHELKEEEPAPQALDDEAAFRLWEESEKILARMGY